MSDARTAPDTKVSGSPWWAFVFENAATPYAVVAVLVLCAPGEQHLAQMAGWTVWLSWLYASLLAIYAGLAARLAGVRQPGERGYRSAVAGAVIALFLAMAAQPISHLFVTGWLSATPRTPVWLVVTVSFIPPLVLGHLLHFAGRPGQLSARTDKTADSTTDTKPDTWTIVPPRADKTFVPAQPAADTVRTTRPAARTAVADKPADTKPDTRTAPVTVSAPADSTPDNVRAIDSGTPSVSALVRDFVRAGLSDEDIKTAVLGKHPDTKPDTLGKSIRRARTGRHARTA